MFLYRIGAQTRLSTNKTATHTGINYKRDLKAAKSLALIIGVYAVCLCPLISLYLIYLDHPMPRIVFRCCTYFSYSRDYFVWWLIWSISPFLSCQGNTDEVVYCYVCSGVGLNSVNDEIIQGGWQDGCKDRIMKNNSFDGNDDTWSI